MHALKQCVRAQAEKARTGKGHVPYRDQVLTRLLRDSFEADGLDCRLAMVGCISPGAADCEHTDCEQKQQQQQQQQPVDHRDILVAEAA